MRRFVLAIVVAGLVVCPDAFAPEKQLTVVDNLNELLIKPAAFEQTVLVLGTTFPFDSPLRIAKHYRTLVYPTNGVNVFPAVNGGEWFLTLVGSTAVGGPVGEIALACDDGTVHSVTLGYVNSTFTPYVDQSASLQFPVSLYLESQDGTSHKIGIAKDVGTGVYTLAVHQGNSVVAPVTVALIAPDTSEHTLTLVTNYSAHTLAVTQ